MTDYGQLEVEMRTPKGKGAARQLRLAGKIPAVVYGRGQDNLSLAIDPHALRKATDPAREYNTFFQLAVMKDGKRVGTESCIVADLQIDSLRHNVVHVDFLRVDPQEEVVRHVPVRVTGRAVGVMKGGRIKTFRRTVRIAAKPASIPVEIVVDVTPLDMGQSIRMRDIALTDARIDEPPEANLALCEAAKAVKDEAAPGAPEGAAKPAAAPAGKAPAKAAPAKTDKK